MGAIFEAFGVDARLIVIQIFNFGLLVALLWYFLYTPILKLLSERQSKIEKGVEDAEAASLKLEEAEGEKKEILTQAQNEAQDVQVRAKEHAKEKEGEILREAEIKATRILEEAEVKSDALTESARKESEAEIAKLAVLAAEKVLLEKKT